MTELTKRSLEVFQELIEAYIETGEPIGSRTLAKRICEKNIFCSDQKQKINVINDPIQKLKISPATIRNIMADLEDAGFLYAPHTSSGRLPTDYGLKFFVEGVLQVSKLSAIEKKEIKDNLNISNDSLEDVLEGVSKTLSGLSRCATVVSATKTDSTLKHIEIIYLAPKKALVILISNDGIVENRIASMPEDATKETLELASKYLNSYIGSLDSNNKTLNEIKNVVLNDLLIHKNEIDYLVAKSVEAGLFSIPYDQHSNLIVKGKSNLLESITEIDELKDIKSLFEQLENKKDLSKILDATIEADGVQIFIGSQNRLFNASGCSVVISPYHNTKKEIIGVIGVIGPTRMNYGKIIPLVDYTARIISKLQNNF